MLGNKLIETYVLYLLILFRLFNEIALEQGSGLPSGGSSKLNIRQSSYLALCALIFRSAPRIHCVA